MQPDTPSNQLALRRILMNTNKNQHLLPVLIKNRHVDQQHKAALQFQPMVNCLYCCLLSLILIVATRYKQANSKELADH